MNPASRTAWDGDPVAILAKKEIETRAPDQHGCRRKTKKKSKGKTSILIFIIIRPRFHFIPRSHTSSRASHHSDSHAVLRIRRSAVQNTNRRVWSHVAVVAAL